MNQEYLQKLAPKAQQMQGQAAFTASQGGSRRLDRKQQKAREAAVIQQLWTEAYRQGLTKFAVPPILVSLFLRALWNVVWFYAQKILSEYEGKKA